MSISENDMLEGSNIEEVEENEAQEGGNFQTPQNYHMVNGNHDSQGMNHGPPVSVDHPLQRQLVTINGASSNNTYRLPVSNLPSSFRLDTNGHLNHYCLAQSEVTAVNWNMISPMNQLGVYDLPQIFGEVYSMPQPSLRNGVGPHEMMQGMRTTRAYQQNGLPPNLNMRMAYWIPDGQANPAQIHLGNPRPVMNSLYDPMYQTLGLPVDPHLRMFLARRD